MTYRSLYRDQFVEFILGRYGPASISHCLCSLAHLRTPGVGTKPNTSPRRRGNAAKTDKLAGALRSVLVGVLGWREIVMCIAGSAT